jgi:hypothetical protein
MDKKARMLELQVAMFVVQKNLPFAIADNFVDFLKKIEINHHIQKKLRCKQTKCAALIQNALGRYSQERLIETLKREKFSIIIDEATDITIEKHLAVCVRHLSDEPFVVNDNFLALFEVRLVV